ncbi:MAG TPA: hypothetical protein ENI61_02405 [Ignavibacteria bacterium]|nr:hypothetical protein [Ignavibacteria bacterium]
MNNERGIIYMKSFNKFYGYIFLLITVTLLQSCTPQLVNLSIAKDRVIEYHSSGQYNKDLNKVVKNAEDQFNKLTIKKNDAVVFDIDETTLSNYEFDKAGGFGYVRSLWGKWVESAKLPAIPQVKKLYNYLVKRNVKIIFLTGRRDYHYNATLKNLKNVGYVSFDTLITRTPSEFKMTALDYKSRVRIELTHKGYHIIGDVGDQWSDLRGPYHGIQVKIPDYQYLIK